MDSGSKQYKNVSQGLKRRFYTIKSDYSSDINTVHPRKRFGFSSASKLNGSSKYEPKDSSYYKLDERVLSNHWLFSDELPKKNSYTTQNNTHLNHNSIVTTRVPSIEIIKGFKLASGKQFDGINLHKKSHFRKFLGLDDDDFSTNDRNFKIPTSRYDQFHPPKSFRSANSTNVYEDSYRDTLSFSQSTTEAHTPRNLSYIEVWNSVCTFTKCYTSNMSPNVLSILWRQYGNPFKVTGSNAEYYKYLLYTHENDFVSLGGVREVTACFKKLVSNFIEKRELFNDEWIRDKYKVLTLSSCRRYRKKVIKLYQKSNLEDAIGNVPLPNPINILKMLLRCVRKEISGQVSIVKKIFQAITHLGNDFIYRANSDAKAVKLSCTEYTKLDIVENNVKIPEELLDKNEFSQILFNKLPTLSLPEDSNDLNEFNSIIYERDATIPFLGQICDMNGVVLHVGELESSQKYCFLRFFMLTTKLQLACVKVNYKNHIQQNDKLSICSEIRSVEKRLKSLVVKFDYEGKGPKDEETNMFHCVYNTQYTGYDGENGIHNFQTGCEHVRFYI
ncbi:hypothetical protein MACK_000758 [Theileria orientalis]|uniref:Uncharacterized protein n=1 Tax=Theileria orientalis TaxID=68886 RepID=A0A976MAI5_THEOR|nr:hypothetical protein MACK_000758 [Theileria orientalis]